jgi:hypothetical protein
VFVLALLFAPDLLGFLFFETFGAIVRLIGGQASDDGRKESN